MLMDKIYTRYGLLSILFRGAVCGGVWRVESKEWREKRRRGCPLLSASERCSTLAYERLMHDWKAPFFLGYDPVALACSRLKACPVRDKQAVSGEADQIFFFELSGGSGCLVAVHTKDLCQEIVCHENFAILDTVGGHQYPSYEAFLDIVKTMARRGDRGLNHSEL